MFKILLKLKKAWKSVLIVVVLLIVQAMGELALPDYTSKIVNVGIQQGGIESCVPDAIREASMQNILLATEDDDYILDKYTLLSKSNLNSEDYEKDLKARSLLKNYVLYADYKKLAEFRELYGAEYALLQADYYKPTDV